MKNQINRKQLIFMDWKFKMVKMASTSLVVQWLRLHTPNARALSLVPGQGTRPHMPQLKIQHSQINKHIIYIYIYMAVLLKLIYRFNAISMKMTTDFSAGIVRLVLKFMLK